MLADLKESWKTFRKGRPGDRFESFFRARRKKRDGSRIALLIVGILLIAGGVILLFIPGPGLLLIAFGGALVAQQSLWMAKLLDEIELVARRMARLAARFWKASSIPVRALVVLAAAAGSAAAAYAAFVLLIRG